jgi:hypothetical protein
VQQKCRFWQCHGIGLDAQCASCHDVARIGNNFAKGIEFLEEGGGRERFVEMGFGGNGAVVSPWSVPFFWFVLLFNFVSCGGKKRGGEVTPTDGFLTDGFFGYASLDSGEVVAQFWLCVSKFCTKLAFHKSALTTVSMMMSIFETKRSHLLVFPRKVLTYRSLRMLA